MMELETLPEYYKSRNGKSVMEPIEVIQNWDLNFCLGNVVKYVFRAGSKPGESRLKDLEKAKTYIEFEIESEEKKESVLCEE